MKNLFLISLLAALCLVSYSCEDKKSDPGEFEHSDLPFDENTTTNREWLEGTATQFFELVNPEHQRATIIALKAFTDLCDSYTFPANFDIESSSRAAAAARSASDAMNHYDYFGISRAVNDIAFNLARFKGLYQATPATESWNRIEDRDDVVFRYFIGTSEYNLTISGEGGSWTETVNVDGDRYTVDVPKTINMLLVSGGIASTNSLMTNNIKTDAKDNNYLNSNGTLKIANVYIEYSYKSNNSKITEDCTLHIDNPATYYRNTVLNVKSEITGSNLCSINAWINAGRDDSGNSIYSMISKANSQLMLMRRVQIKADLVDLRAFVDGVDGWWDSYDYTDPKAQAEKAAKSLSQAIKAQLFYSGESKVRGNMGWEAYMYDDWYDYEGWAVRPTVTFTSASDNGTYDFEAYFGNHRFMSVENTFNRLMKSYRSYWK